MTRAGAAGSASGHGGAMAGGTEHGFGRVRGVVGCLQRRAGKQEVAGCARARRARARRPSGAVETTTSSASQLGRPVGPLGCLAAGKVQVGFFLYFFSFLFF